MMGFEKIGTKASIKGAQWKKPSTRIFLNP